MIKYTIVCPNCGKTKTFEKKFPSSREKKFCNQGCANSYTNREKWADSNFREKMDKIHRSPEYRQKLSASITELWTKSEYRSKNQDERIEYTIICPNCDKECIFERLPKEQEKKFCCQPCANSYTSRERGKDPKYRQKVSLAVTEIWADPSYKQKMKIIFNSPERNEKLSKSLKAFWADPERANQQAQKIRRGCHTRPTKPELELFRLLNSNGYRYIYIGDGGLCFGAKNPDFIWPERRLIVECFGAYWHDKTEAKPRIEHFANYGFRTLIIWDYELNDKKRLLIRLKEFHQSTD